MNCLISKLNELFRETYGKIIKHFAEILEHGCSQAFSFYISYEDDSFLNHYLIKKTYFNLVENYIFLFVI